MSAAVEPTLILSDDLVTTEDRFGVYERGDDGRPRELATTSRDGLGLTIITLMNERRAHLEKIGEPVGCPVLGILDRLERRWVCGLWTRGDHL